MLHAERAAAASELADRRAQVNALQLRLQAKRTELENASSTRQPALSSETQNLVTSGVGQIATALFGTIVKTKELSASLRDRASSVQGLGVDTAETVASLDQADVSLSLAEETLKGLDISARYAATSENPMTDWSETRQQFLAVRDLIIEAREHLRLATTALRSALLSN